MSKPYDQDGMKSPKEELEILEFNMMNVYHGLGMKFKEEIDTEKMDADSIETSIIDACTQMSETIRIALSTIGAIASQLHVLETLTDNEFELILFSLKDVREQAMEEVMAGDHDMSPVDFVDGILRKLNGASE